MGYLELLVKQYWRKLMLEMIKKAYERGLWTDTILKMAVSNNFLSKEKFKEITGKEYLEDTK